MVVTFSTFWSRVKRRNVTVLSCTVQTIEMAAAVLHIAEKDCQPVILTIDASKMTILPEVLTAACYRLACASKELALIEIKGLDNKNQITRGLMATTQILRLTSDTTFVTFSDWLRKQIVPGQATASNLEWNGQYDTLRATVISQNLNLLHLVLGPKSPELSPQFLVETRKKLPVPLVVTIEHLSPARLKRLLKAGVDGVGLDTILTDSYTAGLRTGLRNRNASEPLEYLPVAEKAVRQSVHLYSQLFNT